MIDTGRKVSLLVYLPNMYVEILDHYIERSQMSLKRSNAAMEILKDTLAELRENQSVQIPCNLNDVGITPIMMQIPVDMNDDLLGLGMPFSKKKVAEILLMMRLEEYRQRYWEGHG